MLISRTSVPGARRLGGTPSEWDGSSTPSRPGSRRYWIKWRYFDDIRRIRTLLSRTDTLTLFLEGGTPMERSVLVRSILSQPRMSAAGADVWLDVGKGGHVEVPSKSGALPWVIDGAHRLSDEALGRLALALHQQPRVLLLLADHPDERLGELGSVNSNLNGHIQLAPMGRDQCNDFLEHMLSGPVARSTQEALWIATGGELLAAYALVCQHLQRGTLSRAGGVWMISEWGSGTGVMGVVGNLLDAESTLSAGAQELLAEVSDSSDGYAVGVSRVSDAPEILELERAGLIRVDSRSSEPGVESILRVNLLSDLHESRDSHVPVMSRKALMVEFAQVCTQADKAKRDGNTTVLGEHVERLRAIQTSLESPLAQRMVDALARDMPAETTVSNGQTQEAPWVESLWLLVIDGEWDQFHRALDGVFGGGRTISSESAALMELLLALEAFLQEKPGIARIHMGACLRVLTVPHDVTFARAAFALSAVIAAQAGRKKKAAADLRRVELIPASPHRVVEGLVSVLVTRTQVILGELVQERGSLIRSDIETWGSPETQVTGDDEFVQHRASLRVLALFLGNAPATESEFDHVLDIACAVDTPLAKSLCATLTAMRETTLEHVQHAIDVCVRHRMRCLEKRSRHMLAQLSPHGARRMAPRHAGFPERSYAEGLHNLTARETQVLELLRSGASNREISEELAVSVRTVESHVGRVLHKLGMSRRHEVAHLRAHPGMILPSVHANPDPVGGL